MICTIFWDFGGSGKGRAGESQSGFLDFRLSWDLAKESAIPCGRADSLSEISIDTPENSPTARSPTPLPASVAKNNPQSSKSDNFMTHFGPDFEYFLRSDQDPSGTDPD